MLALAAGAVASQQQCTSDDANRGLDAGRHGVARRWADAFVESGRLAGLVVAVRRDDDLFIHASGAHSEDSIFRICSMTKAVVAVAAASMIEDGLLPLGLQTPVASLVPELAAPKVIEVCGAREPDPACPLAAGGHRYRLVPAWRNITIEDLLTHRGGFTYPFFREKFDATRRHPAADVAAALMQQASPPVLDGCHTDGAEAERGVDAAANVRRLAALPLVSQPGTAYSYGLDTDVLGVALEAASGLPLGELLSRRVLAPLGMNDTAFSIAPGDAPRLARLASLYRYDDARGALRSCAAASAAASAAAGAATGAVAGAAGEVPPWCAAAQDAYVTGAPLLQSGGCGLLSTARCCIDLQPGCIGLQPGCIGSGRAGL